VIRLKWHIKNGIPIPMDKHADFMSVEDNVIHREETRLIGEWLKNKANPKEKYIIWYHHFENLSYRQIAEILHEKENTVKSTGWRAQQKIRQYIINAIYSETGE
jgi:RNA polymerase sigma factor (sigma-70 family)